jgi:hypothetical protein
VLPDLRIDAPHLEPDPVLLEQLSQLAKGSVRHGGPGTARGVLAAATVVVVTGLSWMTGTLPGVASPFHREPSQQPIHQPMPQQDPVTAPDSQSAPEGSVPSGPDVVPPGPAKPHHDQGQHTGQTKPHHNNGNHTGQTKPHHNNGNHTGQTKPHHNNGNHTGQTKPHHNSGQGLGNGHVK